MDQKQWEIETVIKDKNKLDNLSFSLEMLQDGYLEKYRRE